LLFELGPAEHFKTEFIVATMIDPAIPDSQTTATHTEPTIVTQSNAASRNASARVSHRETNGTQGSSSSRMTQNEDIYNFAAPDIAPPIDQYPDPRLVQLNAAGNSASGIRPLLPMDFANGSNNEMMRDFPLFEENQEEITMATDPAFAQLRSIAEAQRNRFSARPNDNRTEIPDDYIAPSQRPQKVSRLLSM